MTLLGEATIGARADLHVHPLRWYGQQFACQNGDVSVVHPNCRLSDCRGRVRRVCVNVLRAA